MDIQCIYIKTVFSLNRHKQIVSPGEQRAWTKKAEKCNIHLK